MYLNNGIYIVVTKVRCNLFFWYMKKIKPKKTSNLEKTVKRKHYNNKDIQNLSKRIKELRIAQGYENYEVFAYEKEISRSQYGRYEKGEDLRFSSLMKLIRAFNISPEEFFSGFDKDTSKTKLSIIK